VPISRSPRQKADALWPCGSSTGTSKPSIRALTRIPMWRSPSSAFAQLLAPPTSLFAPNLFRRVIWGNYQRRRLRRTKPDERIFTTSDPATSSPRR
jgi:hypothetical protein